MTMDTSIDVKSLEAEIKRNEATIERCEATNKLISELIVQITGVKPVKVIAKVAKKKTISRVKKNVGLANTTLSHLAANKGTKFTVENIFDAMALQYPKMKFKDCAAIVSYLATANKIRRERLTMDNGLTKMYYWFEEAGI